MFLKTVQGEMVNVSQLYSWGSLPINDKNRLTEKHDGYPVEGDKTHVVIISIIGEYGKFEPLTLWGPDTFENCEKCEKYLEHQILQF